ncbi:hypothetical protein B6I21_02010 [candidate division KSB1 bacterium 4572_119]|nr:MAG: hypothetical protein B6I21_02010 [candidate division KSB1 bacterium 4572_119]
MSKKITVLIILTVLLVSLIGCAKRIPINYDQTRTNALIEIKTVTGKTCEGLVRAKKPSFLVLQTDKYKKRSVVKINRDDISHILGKNNYVTDGAGAVISEWEIENSQKNNSLLLYTLGGGGFSFGASFFAGSLINKSMDNVDNGKTAMWATTAVGTTLGTLLFARAGAKKDRTESIEKIREQHYDLAKQKAEQDRLKRKKLQEELQKLKAEREKQKQEIEQLKEKAQKEKK